MLFERLETKAAVVLASASLLAGASGCDLTTSKYADVPQVPRCDGGPMPEHVNPEPEPKEPPQPTPDTYSNPQKWRKYQKAERAYYKADDNYLFEGGYPRLEVPVNNAGFIDNDPEYSPGSGLIDDKISKGVVQISNGDYHGSGFVTLDKNGDQVIVTAAHVLGTTLLSSLDITANNEDSTHPVSGCYVYDSKGNHLKLTNSDGKKGGPPDYDLAVLRPEEDLPVQPLTFSPTQAKRSKWVRFVNYQGAYPTIGFPSEYTGLVVAPDKSETGLTALTGLVELTPPITNGEFEDSHLTGGASGGPVTDRQGRVIGISTAGDKDGIYMGPSEIKFFYNVVFPGANYGDGGGFVPVEASMTPSYLIEKAIGSITPPKR
jgi:hypothetical protein